MGALLGGYACITIAKNYSWNLAFGLAAIVVMTISLLTFVFPQRSLGPIGLLPSYRQMQTGRQKTRMSMPLTLARCLSFPSL